MHAATHSYPAPPVGRLQYDLWLGKNGLSDYRELSTAIERQQQEQPGTQDRNSLIYRKSTILPLALRPSRSCRATILATSSRARPSTESFPKKGSGDGA